MWFYINLNSTIKDANMNFWCTISFARQLNDEQKHIVDARIQLNGFLRFPRIYLQIFSLINENMFEALVMQLWVE